MRNPISLVLVAACTLLPVRAAAGQPPSDSDCLGRAAALAREFDAPGYVRRANLPDLLVFVHGAKQTGRSGWTNPAGGYWPALILCDPAFRSYDVFVAEFDADEEDGVDLADVVEELTENFTKHEVFVRRRETTIVARDLGGIVARELLQRQPSLGTLVSRIAWIDPAGDLDPDAWRSTRLRHRGETFSLSEYHTREGMVPQQFRPDLAIQCATATSANAITLAPRKGAAVFCTSEPVALPLANSFGWLPDTPSAPLHAWLRRVLPPAAMTANQPDAPPPPSTRTVQVSGPSLDVGCNQASAGVLPLKLQKAAGEEVVLARAVVADQSNLKSATASVVRTAGDEVLVEYSFVGLDRQWTGNCPGGGHGRVVLTVVLKSVIAK